MAYYRNKLPPLPADWPDLKRGRWAPATVTSYTIACQDWCMWCRENGEQPLPADPEALSRYVHERAQTIKMSTLSGRLAALVAVHTLNGTPLRISETCARDAVAEARRSYGTARTPKAALTVEDVKRIIRGIPVTKTRDRALILFAEASLMRRSEIVALNVDDLTFEDDALHVRICRSKTDKAGKGETVVLLRSKTEFCPVTALQRHLLDGGITEGAVWRHAYGGRMPARQVATIGKRWAKAAGFAEAEIGAHSFRRGGITSMFRAGAKIEDIMRVSRHKTVGIALGYVEAQRAALNPALKALGL